MTGGAGEDPGLIAIVSHSHPSLSKGGAEIAAYTLFTGLISLGLDAVFLGACPENATGKLALGSSREIPVFYDPSQYDPFYHLATPSLASAVRQALPAATKIVNCHHYLHLGLGALRALASNPNLTTTLTLHEFLAICHHHGQMVTRPSQILCTEASPSACIACFPGHTRQEFALRRKLFVDVFGRLDGLISPSRFLADRYVAWGCDPNRVEVIENGLAHLPEARPGRAEGPFVFGFFGQINPFKGVDTILSAVELIARSPALQQRVRVRIHGNIIGQPEAFIARLEALAATNPFFSLAGPYDNRQVARLMSECDYLLVPSRWWENSPLVIQEAYAVRRPVICSGIGGMAEKVVDGVTGLHFRVGDHGDLARAIETAADTETHARLQSGIPAASDARSMAEGYLAAFQHFALNHAGNEPKIAV